MRFKGWKGWIAGVVITGLLILGLRSWSVRSTGSVAATGPTTSTPAEKSRTKADTVAAKQAQVQARAAVWNRLGNAPKVREKTSSGPGDFEVHKTWVRYPGKYPNVLVRETYRVNPSTGEKALTEQVAMVADHLLVKRRDGIPRRDFEQGLTQAGITSFTRLSSEGLYLTRFRAVDTESLDQAMTQLAASKQVAFAEPDYLVFSSEDVGSRRPVIRDATGAFIDTVVAGKLDEMNLAIVPPADQEFLAGELTRLLQSLPAGARVLTFDPPDHTDGPGSYAPYLLMQNFKLNVEGSSPSNEYVYVQGPYTSGYPNNGTYYTRLLSGQYRLVVSHADGLPFSACGLDVSEYSTYFATPMTVTVSGYTAGGQVVTQTFTTDGIMDGTGPLTDFQTFTLNASFTNLVKLTIAATYPMMIDNIAVVVEGQEMPPIPPPQEPLIYSVTWDAPKHVVGQITGVSGPYAPTNVNFGTPTVRAGVGTMPGPALELKGGSGYQQIQFNLEKSARLYRFEFDAYLDNPDEFRILVDGLNSYSTVASASFYANGTGSNIGSGPFPFKKVFRIRADLNLDTQTCELFLDGQSRSVINFSSAVDDIHDVRLHMSSNNPNVLVGIDNVTVSAYSVDTQPSTGPRLIVRPSQFIYPDTTVGSGKAWFMELINTGGQQLVVNSITSNHASFRVSDKGPISILPGGSYQVALTFSPTMAGPQSGVIALTSNDTNHASVNFPVSGTGITVPTIAVTPSILSVTMPQNITGTRSFNIANVGSGNLSWNLVLQVTQPGQGTTNPVTPVDPVTPSDPYYSTLWAMRAPLGTSMGGIDATHAWRTNTGSPDLMVGVIDTGVDLTHPDLSGNVDTVNGRNFITGGGNGQDDNGHGTHVAGTIAARGNNGTGVTGVAWRCKIVPLKFLDSSGSGYTSDAIEAVNYAASKQIRILSNSWGGGGYSQSLRDAIATSGTLFIAAAGNKAQNNDTLPHYPSSYDCYNIISVAATSSSDTLAYFSNYGGTSVDLGAPGETILSTYLNQEYATMSGTSMATPHVTGVSVLLLTKNPDLNLNQLKQLLLHSTDTRYTLSGRTQSGGRLNAYNAVNMTMPSWLKPLVTYGSVAAGTSQNIPLSISTANLPTGQYVQTLSIDSLDPIHPNLQIPVILNVVASSPLNLWKSNKFGTGYMLDNDNASSWSDTADPNHNGLPNLLEYALGTEPTDAGASNLKKEIVHAADGQDYLTLTYICPVPAPVDVNYTVEVSNDLATWRTAITEVSRTNNGDGTQTIKTRSQTPLSSTTREFIRLRISH